MCDQTEGSTADHHHPPAANATRYTSAHGFSLRDPFDRTAGPFRWKRGQLSYPSSRDARLAHQINNINGRL